MKRIGYGKRLMALVLALTMFVSLVPSVANRALAAKAGDTFEGVTGLSSNINTKDTISWPIKIYDYLNDGMLFEYSSAQDDDITAHGGGSYGGGRPMPVIDYSVPGVDYTSVQGYFTYDYDEDAETYVYNPRYSFQNWANRSAYKCRYDGNATEVERSINDPVDNVSPMSLHLTYVGEPNSSGGYSKSYSWVSNFARDEGKYYSKEDVRYMVIVYKTNEAYSEKSNGVGHAIRPYWAVSDNAYSAGVDISDVSDTLGWKSGSNPTGTLVAKEVRLAPSTDTWGYQIFDLKTNIQDSLLATNQSGYGIAENWDNIGDERIAGVGMSLPICQPGEEMDISHIAYFGSEFEANEFGQNCVEFNNDPGEYLGYDISMTHTVTGGTTSSSYSAPTTASGDWNFTTSSGSGWSNTVYKTTWSDGNHGITKTSKEGNGYTYTNITCPDSSMDTGTLWSSSSLSDIENRQYITLVYRIYGNDSPTIGFWAADTVGSSYYDYYAGGKVSKGSSHASAGVTTTRVDIPVQENGEWMAFTYNLDWLESKFGYTIDGYVGTINFIGIKFPGFTSSAQSMDLAYVKFSSDATTASNFETAATNYLNNFKTTNGNSVTTSVTKSASVVGGEMWNMGGNQAFGLLYASTGGGWMDSDSDYDTGGVNSWTNGYYSYPIGYNYANPSGSANAQRTAAESLSKNYRVSSSIYLLNTYSDLDSSIDGLGYTLNSEGNQVNKTVDMSYLPLGYTLYNVMKGDGVMTAGLLQSGLTSYVGVDGKEYKIMQYKDDTTHYLATLLRDTLVIPQRDFWGYNYNFVMGSESVKFYEDWDGDGKLDTANEDIDGDGKLDTVNEDKNNNGKLDKSEDLDFDSNLDIYEDLDYDGFLDPAEDIDGDGHFDKYEDLNNDGILDPGEDWDNDGKLDLIEDLNHNGQLDEGEDRNGNGVLDLVEDVNGNGVLDASEDVDGDGKLDLIEDLNHNGQFDEGEDLNGNGVFDLTEDVNSNKALDSGEDLDNDGNLDVNEDTDNDGFLDIDERTLGNKDSVLDKRDLASALRERLGIVFDYDKILADSNGNGQPDNAQQATATAELGSYTDTINRVVTTDANGKKVNGLIGPYLQCADNIKTFYDAAYYLLHNLFVDNSYNQLETDYRYLVMSKATVTGGARDGSNKDAFVFDAGFCYDDGTSGTIYDEVTKTISQATAESKWGIYYTDKYDTTLHPFLPINDEGEGRDTEFRATGTPYFREDGATNVDSAGNTYAGRNYNYVMAANGEFVYHADDDLFFQFQGDDDVYMFINGELVLDIGAAHSITDVSFYMNDYVNAAATVLDSLEGYLPEMSDAEFAKVLADNGVTTSYTYGEKTYDLATLNRMHKLYLVDGHAYSIDFYYMERHGWGANMRIATNIVMTDPTLTTDKNAYQGMDSNGNYNEVDYGGLVDDANPIDYEFAISNEGNTKLYKLSYKDPSIGVDLTYEDGLLVYGKPTVANFTTTSDTTLRVTNLEGAFNLDGKVYFVSTDGTLSWEEDGETKTAEAIAVSHDQNNPASNFHTLTLYQLNRSTLYTDQMVAIRLGGDTGGQASQNATTGIYTIDQDRTTRIPVAGIRASDANGGKLDVSDLVITVDGYASPEDYEAGIAIDTITIKLKTNDQLKQFLTNLQDPNSQTSTGEGIPAGKNSLYWGAGLWQHATVTISGLWYTMSPAEQEAKVFENTVYTNGYKSMDSLDPLKGQASHRVYSPGEPMYYQWAGHTVYLEKSRLWADVVANSTDDSNMLYEQQLGINALGTDVSKLVMELTDSHGNPLSKIGDNMYINGYWTTYANPATPSAGNKVIYFKNVNHWDQINAYYWSEDNTAMVENGFPGSVMQKVEGEADLYYVEIPEAAEYIIFSNAGTSQTADLTLPANDLTRISISEDNSVVNVNFTTPGMHMFYVKVTSTDSSVTAKAMVPVSFLVTKVKDSTYVLDYGLHTEDLNTSGTLFAGDHLLGNQASTTATLMGVTTTQPGYLDTYSAALSELSNINRIDFTKTAQTRFDADNAADESVYLQAADGKYFLSSLLGDGGVDIQFVGNRYTMDKRIWFTPEKFMDEPSEMWLAINVHDTDAVNPTAAETVTGDRFHIPGPANTSAETYTLDIGTEVQMYKKITVIPATVVYYEDDFAGVSYNKTGDNAGSFVTHGKGSGSLTQSVNQSQPYGQDMIYQTPANGLFSGNIMTTINISEYEETAAFTFTGTGFEMISRTNAFDSASFVVDVYDSSDTLVNRIPVITEFTNVATACTHSYHNTNGFCTYCNKHVSHSYTDGSCTLCGASEVKYYLNGWINESDYQGSDDAYTFKDGRLTVTFNKDSYVYVRDENNVQYWTNGYAGNLATSAMLYESSTIDYDDKLRVPGGVEVTFTLVDNGGGAMILSYTTSTTQAGERTLYFDNTATGWTDVYIYYWSEANGQMHIWPGSAMDRIGDTAIYKYVVPADAEQVIFNNGQGGTGNQTSDMLIPGDGYVYNNGVWSEYGKTDDSDMITLFFDNVDGWEQVYAHYWHYTSLTDTSQTAGTTWNGVLMTKVEGTNSLYTIKVPKEMTMVLFNDGTGNQTADLQILEDNSTYRSGVWYDAQNAEITTKRIYYKNSNGWATPNAWVWTAPDTNAFPEISWPGPKMTNVIGTDYWYIDVPVTANRIIFSDAGNNQTNDLLLYGHLTTYEAGVWTDVIPVEQSRIVYFENDQLWDEVWAYYYVQDGATFATFPGVKMEKVEGNFYQVSVPNEANMIIFSNGNGTQTADLSLPTGENLYSQGQWKTFVSGAGREICQVPAVRVSDLAYGTYTVKISGMPTYTFDEEYNITGTETTYLYIDGVRIFQPMTGNNNSYTATEDGATFVELRNLILNGMAAMAKYDVTLSAFTGSMFWTENRNGKLHDFVTDEDADYFGNRVSSVNDYMVVGPNNEVYLNGNLNNEAVVFYVTEQAQTTGRTSENRTVQIAARAIDSGLFTSGQSTGVEATLYQGVLINMPDGSTRYGWNAIDTIQSGTEQYYVIDYASCPYTEEDGVKTYQIALYVRSGMVSFTSVKYNGFTITGTDLSEPTNLSYVDGQMMVVQADGGAMPAMMTLRLPALSAQMRSATFLSETGEEESEELTQPTLTLGAPSLSFEDEVRYNIYFSATDLEDVVDMGLITFSEKLTDGTMDDALEVFPGYVTDGVRYMVHTGGVAAKNLGDTVYFKVYAKLTDGSYVYSDVAGYNAVAYAKQILKNSDSEEMKALVVAMMNYGAEAQKFLGYKTDALVNSFLTDEQKALVKDFDMSMIDGLVPVDTSKIGAFAYTSEGFTGRRPSVSFNSRFSINYYFTTAFVPEGQVTMYYWDQAAYESAEELTAENATGVVFMKSSDGSRNFWADVSGIAAKELGKSVYVAAVYSDGTNTYSTGVLGYSIDAYCQSLIQNGMMTALAQSAVVYGDYAKNYFANLAD